MVACYCRKLFQVKKITQNAAGMYMLIAVTLSGLDNHNIVVGFFGVFSATANGPSVQILTCTGDIFTDPEAKGTLFF